VRRRYQVLEKDENYAKIIKKYLILHISALTCLREYSDCFCGFIANGYKFTIGGGVKINGTVDANGANVYSTGLITTGNVGVGHNAPIAPLCVGNSSLAGSDGFILIGKNNGTGGSRHMRIGFNDSFQLTIGDAGSGTLGAWTQAFKIAYNAPVSSFTMDSGGAIDAPYNIACGSIYCRGPMQTLGPSYWGADLWHKSGDSKDRIYFATNATTYYKSGTGSLGRVHTWRNSLDQDVAYIDSYYFYTFGVGTISDRRIKRDIEEINDETALNMILLVQPVTYYYRDEARNKGNGKVYGFIAQQIKEVIPDAVMITKDIIANIYKTCLIYNKREIYHSIPLDVEIDTEIRILNKEDGDKGNRYKIKEIYEDHFVIDEDIDGDECFVFGYEVKDLNTIDKSYIYTLNVCATQELHRRMEAQEKRIKELETKIEQLINYIYQ
jgi:hypothetical protein